MVKAENMHDVTAEQMLAVQPSPFGPLPSNVADMHSILRNQCRRGLAGV